MREGPSGRSGRGLTDSIRQLDAGTILTALLVAGLLVRILIAGVLLPLSGFAIDRGDFAAWGQRLASVGPPDFYEPGYFSDYPPGYLYVLWLLGLIGGALTPLVGANATVGLVKIPGVLADLGVATMLFVICRRWAGQLIPQALARRGVTGPTLGLLAATVYLFSPGTIFNSSVWGQVDSVGTLVLLLTIYALGRGRTELAAVGAVVALLVKFQFAFLVPVVAIVGIRRHLLGRSSDPAHDGDREPLRVLTSLAVGVVALFLLMLPFRMTLYAPLAGGDPRGLLGILPEADPTRSLIGKFQEAASTYTGLSINAFNLWRNPWSGLGDTLHWGDDTTVGLAVAGISVSWQTVGTLLFAVVALGALVQVARRDDMRGVLVASLVLAVAFFVLPTRVHERYLFPAIALTAPLLLAGRPWPWIAGGSGLSFFANVYWVYTEDWSFAEGVMNPGVNGQPMPQDAVLTQTLFTDPGIWLLSAMIVAVLAAVVWQSRLLVERRAATHSARGAAEVSPPIVPRSRGAPRRGPSPQTGPTGRTLLTPNAADAYLHERPRRLDRRDALILLGLVLFALVFRLWRLDVPRGQHFDEVYHARSAAEFLSAWEFGFERDVYEWTHPMLAKYLIAGGIELADPNKVVASHSIERPSSALAVAPERRSLGWDRSIAFTSRGSTTITARDAVTGDEIVTWEAPGPIGTVAFDPDGPRLLVGRADSGTIETFGLADLLTAAAPRAPPSLTAIETGLESVNEILVGPGTEATLVRGADGVSSLDGATDAVRATSQGSYGGMARVGMVDEDGPWVAVSDTVQNRVELLDGATLQPSTDDGLDTPIAAEVDAPLIGPLIAVGGGEDQRIFALTGPLPATDEHPETDGGIAAIDADGSDSRCGGDPCVLDLVPLPGAPTLIRMQELAGVVYVAGVADEGPQLWTLEPHIERRNDSSVGLATFDSTSLPGTPVAMAFDVATSSPEDDNGRVLVSTAGEEGPAVVTVDAGSNAFAWRLAGVAFGAVLVGLIYLLAATMFSRRRIAVLAAGFVAIDGMSYVMSRISMNDIFVATFIAAAYLLFWQIWSGRWARSAWWVLPVVGVLIGLAAATKWVGFYALAGLLVLVLARSALGRLVLVWLVGAAVVLGGIGAPWPFLLVMIGITLVALAITYQKPLRAHLNDAALAVPATGLVVAGLTTAFLLAFGSVEEAGGVDGPVEYVFALLARGAQAGWPVWLMIGTAVVLIAWRGFNSLGDPASDARWYRPSEMGGFGWSWVGACLVIVPLVVYGLSYVPYLELGHTWSGPNAGPGYGWSVEELHAQMFGYHFNLQEGHASSSPWWSWPLALKPTWFYNSDTFDGTRLAVIYNGGNPMLTWAGLPAIVVCAVLAWKRRSPALAMLVAAFAFQFVPWIRIERATFAYHYLTAVIFAMVAVAYVVDELLRRPLWRSLAIGYLALVVVVGVLVFPLNAAVPMPDWFINAARALPPWNYEFQFPEPPKGDRADLVSGDRVKYVAAAVVATAAAAWAIGGRSWVDRWRLSHGPREARG